MQISHKKTIQIKTVIDISIIVFAYYISKTTANLTFWKIDLLILNTLIIVWYFSSKVTLLYDDYRVETYVLEFSSLMKNVFLQFVIYSLLNFYLGNENYARQNVLVYAMCLILILGFIKYVYKKYLLAIWENGENMKNILIIGNNEITDKIIRMTMKMPHFGIRVLGVISRDEFVNDGVEYLGSIKHLDKILQLDDLDELLITSDRLSKDEIFEIINKAESNGIKTRIIPNYLSGYQRQYYFQSFGPFPMIALRNDPLNDSSTLILKRIFDIVFSSILFLIIFWWLFLIIGIIIKLDSKGPVFFRQKRWGKDGKEFKVFKFRSMVNTDNTFTTDGAFAQATKNDPRITKIGAFLRKSNFDELPQFINVLLGEMSVVGPRPHASQHNEETKDLIDKYLVRHWIKPGITGWAQVHGLRGETNDLKLMEKRVEFDIWYMENWKFALDIQIVFMTAYNMLKGEDMAY
ncbi:MAG: undecaprenyl-phosphate glucose phosphotransferase [Leadbetterella sp.]|nr:undecaprenyl-phosphate glucose phosphotransferase [Leadbetterella sp.]